MAALTVTTNTAPGTPYQVHVDANREDVTILLGTETTSLMLEEVREIVRLAEHLKEARH